MRSLRFLLLCWLCAVVTATWASAYEDFFVAIKQDNPAPMVRLLQRGMDPNTINQEGVPGVMLALRIASFKVAKVLIDHPQLEVNALTQHGESPLMLAALKGQIQLVQTLLERDADVNKTGWTPLHYAATGGHVAVMQVLFDHHAYLDARSPNGTTPLMMAAMYGSPAAVQWLLDAGADWQLENEQGMTALQFAQKAQKADSVETIRAFIRAQNKTGGAW
jgi:hypothetical protein